MANSFRSMMMQRLYRFARIPAERKSSMTSQLRYRPDIDGLRAVSVLAVIAYHAGMGVHGGYVGVDVFFVISGYLITSLIVKDLEKDTFSLARFWERRIRRIWPAAMVMTAVLLVAGYIFMMPTAFRQLAGDTIAQIALLANVQFWRSSDYFAIQSEFRPLLHTWSLAVEEQFYVVFPILLIAAWRIGRRFTIVVLATITVLSFGLSVWAVADYQTLTFFMLPTRAWELMLGALLAIMHLSHPRQPRVCDLIALCGLLLILLPSFLYDDSTQFPGLAALPPCLGAMALIYAGTNRSGLVFRLLASPPLRMIGLMSYSLYLWHWPVFAFMRYTLGENIALEWRVIALIGIAALSFVSWRFVETPFRKLGGQARLARVGAVAAVVSGVLIAVGFLIRADDGVPGRFDESLVRLANPEKFDTSWAIDYAPSSGLKRVMLPIGTKASPREKVSFLLWGDSHAMAISAVIDEIAKNHGVVGTAALRLGTAPLPGVWRPSQGTKGKEAAAWNDEVLDWIRNNAPRHVILCSRWSVYLDGQPNGKLNTLVAPIRELSVTRRRARQAFVSGLNEVIRTCNDVGATVWFLKEVPLQSQTPERRVARARLTGEDVRLAGVSVKRHLRHQQTVDELLEKFAGTNLRVVDLAEPFFLPNGMSQVISQGESLYADNVHVNTIGVRYLLTCTIDDILAEVAKSVLRPLPNSGG